MKSEEIKAEEKKKRDCVGEKDNYSPRGLDFPLNMQSVMSVMKR